MKNSGKHTEGEWRMVSHLKKSNDFHIHVSGKSICQFEKSFEDSNEEEKTNAKLISLAPEFLDACKIALKAFNGEYIHWTHKTVSKKECHRKAKEILEEIIKKYEI